LVQVFLRKYAIKRWFIFPPHLLSVHTLPWETLGTWNNKVSSKNFFKNKQVNYTLFVHDSFLLSSATHKKCSKCCPSAHRNTASWFLHLLMDASMTFCCRLRDVNNVLLQITDAKKFTPVFSRLKIAWKISKISIIKFCCQFNI